MARDASLEHTMERIARQEEVIAHLAASGHATTLAERRLTSLRRSLDAMLARRRARAGEQGDTPFALIPGQLGPRERDGQPGLEAP